MKKIFLNKLKTAIDIIFHEPLRLVNVAGKNGLLNLLSDEKYLKICYRCETGNILHLENPVLFSEKLQWLKIHDRNEAYVSMVDKFAVREYIKHAFGEQYLIPAIGVYNTAHEIPWDTLPPSFVLKCTHGSGCNIVVKDKAKADREAICEQLTNWLKHNWYYYGREWPYKKIIPRIIAEEYQKDCDDHDDLTDYKFYCFNGAPTYCQVIGDRHVENGKTVYYIDFFDMNWEKMPFTGFHSPHKEHPHNPNEVCKPKLFDEMKTIAAKLAKETKFVRIDFYQIEGTIKFGEFTLYPMSGFGVFSPDEWNEKLGNMIDLS